MRHKAHFFLPLAVLAAVVCAALWWAFLSPHMVFQLYDRENERVVLEVPAGPGDSSGWRLNILLSTFPGTNITP